MLLLCALVAGSGTMWGAEGDEITSIANIVDGKSYYIKGVRNVSGNPTTFYLNFTDAIGSQSGTESSTTAGAQLITFHKQSDGVYHLETALGNFIAPGTTNGKIQVAAAGINVTASNQSSKIRLSITSGSNTWSIQKNTSATNFGGYKNTQTDITLIEGPAAVKTDPTITFSNGSVRVGRTLDLSTLFSSNSEGAVTYSITAGGDYASLEGSTLTGVAEGSVTVKAAQATAGNYNAGEASATITVNPALTLSSIAITTPPTKTTYTEGDTFDATGMVVTATYSDASTADVTASCTFSPSTSTALTASNTEITVSYTENAVEKTATQAITVNALSYAIKLAAGTADASNWTITPTSATSGQTVTISYTGSRTITSVSAVKKPFGLSTFSFVTPAGGESSNLTFTGASDEKPVWFKGICNTHNTTGTVTYSNVIAGSYYDLYFNSQFISRSGYPYPTTLYITGGLGTKADPFVLSFDEGSPDMELTVTSAGEKSWTITMPTSDVEIQVLMPYTVTLADDGSELKEASGGAGVTLPSRSDIGSYTFAGWSETNVTEETTEEPAINAAGEYHPTGDITLYPVYTRTEGSVSDVVDEMNRAWTGITGTNYSTWSGKTATSSAVYAGNSAGGNDAIQLRSNNNNSGIVTTASGGKVKKVSISWNSNTNSARKVDVYGKNSAYSAASDLYNASTQGTKLGTIQYSTNEDLTIAGDYEYIGLRSNDGALYLSEVEITWSSGSFTTYYTSLPRVSLSETTDNSEMLTALNGKTCTVTLDRTLTAGIWNTFASPVAITNLSIFGTDAKVRQLKESSVSDNVLTITFEDAASIEAGKPYLVKPKDENVVNPTLEAVTITAAAPVSVTTDYVDFVPTLGKTEVTGNVDNILIMTTSNTLVHPSTVGDMKGFRGYFLMHEAAGARAFVMNFGDGETTGIQTIRMENGTTPAEGTYDLSGRRIQGQPTQKGVYIQNGKKVIIK